MLSWKLLLLFCFNMMIPWFQVSPLALQSIETISIFSDLSASSFLVVLWFSSFHLFLLLFRFPLNCEPPYSCWFSGLSYDYLCEGPLLSLSSLLQFAATAVSEHRWDLALLHILLVQKVKTSQSITSFLDSLYYLITWWARSQGKEGFKDIRINAV